MGVYEGGGAVAFASTPPAGGGGAVGYALTAAMLAAVASAVRDLNSILKRKSEGLVVRGARFRKLSKKSYCMLSLYTHFPHPASARVLRDGREADD